MEPEWSHTQTESAPHQPRLTQREKLAIWLEQKQEREKKGLPINRAAAIRKEREVERVNIGRLGCIRNVPSPFHVPTPQRQQRNASSQSCPERKRQPAVSSKAETSRGRENPRLQRSLTPPRGPAFASREKSVGETSNPALRSSTPPASRVSTPRGNNEKCERARSTPREADKLRKSVDSTLRPLKTVDQRYEEEKRRREAAEKKAKEEALKTQRLFDELRERDRLFAEAQERLREEERKKEDLYRMQEQERRARIDAETRARKDREERERIARESRKKALDDERQIKFSEGRREKLQEAARRKVADVERVKREWKERQDGEKVALTESHLRGRPDRHVFTPSNRSQSEATLGRSNFSHAALTESYSHVPTVPRGNNSPLPDCSLLSALSDDSEPGDNNAVCSTTGGMTSPRATGKSNATWASLVNETVHSPLKEASWSTPVREERQSSPKEASWSTPVKDRQSSPLKEASWSTPVREARQSSPLRESSPVRETMQSSPVRETTWSSPVRETIWSSPVRETSFSSPVRDLEKSWAVRESATVDPQGVLAELFPQNEGGEQTYHRALSPTNSISTHKDSQPEDLVQWKSMIEEATPLAPESLSVLKENYELNNFMEESGIDRAYDFETFLCFETRWRNTGRINHLPVGMLETLVEEPVTNEDFF